MMRRESAGEKVVKAHEYRRLHEENPNRSGKAYEFKMQNISAVLALNDLPYITGLTPADAYQNLLEEMLLERLESDPAERAMVLSYGNGLLQRWTRPGSHFAATDGSTTRRQRAARTEAHIQRIEDRPRRARARLPTLGTIR
ncbi:MAG: hypothetical protein IPL77_07415 [Flavobacteriales bacterium]|nr:hypothetical protein [Flavobacteriales bacterium]